MKLAETIRTYLGVGALNTSVRERSYNNLGTVLELYTGGEGSGCNPDKAKPRCGRPEEGGGRAERALATHKPVSVDKVRAAIKNEERVAEALGGEATPYHSPFDVVTEGKIGIEVKTIIDKGANDKITVHPESRRSKEAWAKENNLKRWYTVVFDQRGWITKIYVKEGVGAYRLGGMQRLKSLKDLEEVIG